MPILYWLTREKDLKASNQAPYRLIEPVDEYSYGDMTTGNMLIQGDNLDALKALLPYYAGSIKCIYIDPPYNTKSAFEEYMRIPVQTDHGFRRKLTIDSTGK